VERATRIDVPVRVVFEWSLDEPDLRVRGRGVARMEPPYRARLDLFGRNGETVLRAALVDDDLRLPPGADTRLVPPPALLWSALGVFRPGGASLLGSGERTGEDRVQLHFRLPGEDSVRYDLLRRMVTEVELLRGGRAVERVALTHGDQRFPREAVYRNLGEFRELRITLDTVEEVDAYPPDIWTPDR